ncbi:MAG: FkbM family methyltransferase [Chitinophagaceae bacterium]|jgi:FkbM family methyltransferase
MRKLHYINKLLHAFGIELVKYNPRNNSSLRRSLFLKKFKFDCVVDVGANIGGFRDELRELGYAGKIHSIEPIVSLYKVLEAKAKSDSLWILHNCALGDQIKDIEINISSNLHSSSVLAILDEHTNAAPDSVYIEKQTVRQLTLDAMQNSFGSFQKLFLKIDTQGYEWNVLEGARQFLNNVDVLQLEMSMVPLYKDQKLFKEIFDFLTSNGFELYEIEPGFSNPQDGQQYQIDCVFVNSAKK